MQEVRTTVAVTPWRKPVGKVLPATATVKVRFLRAVVIPGGGISTVGQEATIAAVDARALISSKAVEVLEGRPFTTISEE